KRMERTMMTDTTISTPPPEALASTAQPSASAASSHTAAKTLANYPSKTPVRRIRDYLFADPDLAVWAVVDGARADSLLDAIYEHQVEHACLYSGELPPDMAEVAPYVVRLEPDAPFTHW